MTRLIIDLDDTLTLSVPDGYENAQPDLAPIARLRDDRAAGFEIVIGNVGKPWCGLDGFYVDDRSIRPSACLRHPLPGIHALLAAEKAGA